MCAVMLLKKHGLNFSSNCFLLKLLIKFTLHLPRTLFITEMGSNSTSDSYLLSGHGQETEEGISLVMQWLRMRLLMQVTQVRALVRENPTCRGANKPVCHNYWACALESMTHNYWGCVLQLLKPAHLEPVLYNKRSHRNEKPAHRNEE